MPLATRTRIGDFVKLTEKKRALETQLKDTKARLADLEPQIVEQFQAEGVQSLNIDGHTIHLIRKLWAGPKNGDKEAMCAALKACGDENWTFLVKDNVNATQLAARVRECELDETTGLPILPDSIKDFVEIYEQFRAGVKKSA